MIRILQITALFLTFVIIKNYSLSMSARAEENQKMTEVPAEVQFVAAGIENARGELKCAQATITRYQFTSKAYLDQFPKRGANALNVDQEVTEVAKWHYTAPRIAINIEYDSKGKQPLRFQRTVHTEDTTQTLITYAGPDSLPYFQGMITPAGDSLRNGLVKMIEVMDPRYHSYYYGHIPLDQLILGRLANQDKTLTVIYKGEEVIDGSRCMVIEGIPTQEDKWVLWIDIEHGFIRRKAETYVRREGKMILASVTQVRQVVESNGVWLPAIVEQRDFSLRGLIDQSVDKRPYNLTRTTISDFKTDCNLPVDAFTMRWPLGMTIHDAIQQLSLTVTPVEKSGLVLLNRKLAEQSKPTLNAIPIEPQDLATLNQQRAEQGIEKLSDAVSVLLSPDNAALLNKITTGNKQNDKVTSAVQELEEKKL